MNRLPLLALLALALVSCQSSRSAKRSQPILSQQRTSLRAKDRPLEDLGLLYDDTLVTVSARTVDFNGQAVVPRYIRTEKSGPGGDLTVDAAVTNIVFGVNPNFTVSVAIPYISKSLDRPAAASTLRAEGLGDAAVVGKYRFFQNTGAGETTEAAVLFGVELPTGRDSVKNGGVTLPQSFQLGSGSVDAIIGGAFTRIQGRWLVNADLIAKINTEANDFQFGNSLRFDVGGHFRAYPARYERYDQMTINLVAELNGIWADENQLNGSDIGASGGTKVFATPGIQVIVSESLLFEGAVQLPVAMNLNGTQLEEDFVAIFGLRFRF